MHDPIAKAHARALPPVVMCIEDVAELFSYSYDYAQKEIVTRPDFPKPIPRFKSPRWTRSSIYEWADIQP